MTTNTCVNAGNTGLLFKRVKQFCGETYTAEDGTRPAPAFFLLPRNIKQVACHTRCKSRYGDSCGVVRV